MIELAADPIDGRLELLPCRRRGTNAARDLDHDQDTIPAPLGADRHSHLLSRRPLDLDPGELVDLADSEPDVRDRLLATLEDWLTKALQDGAGGTGVSPEQSWWLQQLGYVERSVER